MSHPLAYLNWINRGEKQRERYIITWARKKRW